MNFLKKLFGGSLRRPTSVKPSPLAGSVTQKLKATDDVLRCRECGSNRFINEGGKLFCASCGLISPVKPKQEATVDVSAVSAPTTKPSSVRYRGLTFTIDGEYSLVWDDKKIVRGIWYRDRSSIKNPARNRMIVAKATADGLTVLDSDYATTIVGGIGGVEGLQNPEGAILWFDSTREIFGK